MKKLLTFLVFMFILCGCNLHNKTIETTTTNNTEYVYEMSINQDFNFVYHVGAKEPNWGNGIILKLNGEIVQYVSIPYYDASDVDMNTVGEYKVRYHYKDSNYQEVNLYANVSIIERDFFIKRFGGSDSGTIIDVIKLNNGFLAYGYTQKTENNSYNALIYRIDENYDLVWTKNFGTLSHEYVMEVEVSDNNKYYVHIKKDVNGEDFGSELELDVRFVILDDNGNILHDKTISNSWNDVIKDIEITSDGGLIIAGTNESYDETNESRYSSWVVKFDNQLNIVFDKTYDMYYYDIFYGVKEKLDGNYLIYGDVNNEVDGYDGYLAILDQNGNIITENHVLNLPNLKITIAYEDSNGNIFVFGNYRHNKYTTSNALSDDAFIAKFDSNLNLLSTYFFETENDEIINNVLFKDNGNFLITGTTCDSDWTKQKLFISEIDNNLNILYNKVYDYYIRGTYQITEFPSGDFLLSLTDIGEANGQKHFVLFNNNYEIIGDKTFDSVFAFGYFIEKSNSKYILICSTGYSDKDFDLDIASGGTGVVLEFDFE